MPRTGRPRVPRVVVTCAGCPTQMERYPAQVEASTTGRFFCSKDCRDRVGSKPRRKAMSVCEWEACGREFYPRSGAPNRFCSRDCKDTWWARNQREIVCPECGVTFYSRPSEPDVWCSRRCYDLGRKTPVGKRHVNQDGYVLIYRPGAPETYTGDHDLQGWGLEHRIVMAETLGHALPPGSTVHHKNTRRDDNRPSNLELRASAHGQGGDVLDLLDWAREFIEIYGPDEARLRELAAESLRVS